MGFGKLEHEGLSKALAIGGAKFSFPILAILMHARAGKGFNDLLHEIATLTPRTLSLRLKELEQKGLISKNISVGARIKIEYRITEKALVFEKALSELADAGNKL